MKYTIDTEFIDTPTCSELISIGIASEDGRELYLEFEFPKSHLTAWLRENVVPHLKGGATVVTKTEAAEKIRAFIANTGFPEFWCYFGSYDWYWFCRLFGGLMSLPPSWPNLYYEFAHVGRPDAIGNHHNALDDAKGLMAAVKRLHSAHAKLNAILTR